MRTNWLTSHDRRRTSHRPRRLVVEALERRELLSVTPGLVEGAAEGSVPGTDAGNIVAGEPPVDVTTASARNYSPPTPGSSPTFKPANNKPSAP